MSKIEDPKFLEFIEDVEHFMTSVETLASTLVPEQWPEEQIRLRAQKGRFRSYLRDFNELYEKIKELKGEEPDI